MDQGNLVGAGGQHGVGENAVPAILPTGDGVVGIDQARGGVEIKVDVDGAVGAEFEASDEIVVARGGRGAGLVIGADAVVVGIETGVTGILLRAKAKSVGGVAQENHAAVGGGFFEADPEDRAGRAHGGAQETRGISAGSW